MNAAQLLMHGGFETGEEGSPFDVVLQEPMYRLLGTPLKDKRHILYDVPGHSVPQDEAAKETLAWLDKYLGPVNK